MKKRKGSILQRMMAVLLSAVLITGMAWDAAPASVLAQESVSENTPTNGETEPVEGETEQEGTDSEEQETTEPAEETDPEGQKPDGGTEQETPQPDDGTGQETPQPGMEEKEQESVSENDVETEAVEKPLRMMRAAAPQADNIASGTDWVLDKDGKLTITSDDGMADWIQNGLGVHRGAVKRAEIQNSVTSIGETAFTDCSNLTDIMISEDVESIGSNAFAGCKSLKSIAIPDSVTNIGMYAFVGCTSLTKVTMKGGVPPTIGTNAFQGCKFVTDDTQGIYVPDVETYKNATDKGWGAWVAYIIEDSVPTEEHEHGGVTFTAWTKTDSLPTDAGNYYLTENVTLSRSWIVPNGATFLCLNGKTIRAQGRVNVMDIMSGALNLYDCKDTGNITAGECSSAVFNAGTFYMYGGKISGNSSVSWGGGVFTTGIFQMYGGEISGNSAFYCGGGVYVADGIFRMYGGRISGNSTKEPGGGVAIDNGTFYVGGNAVISGNTTDGKVSNVYLADGQTIEIDSSNPLSGSASIGVTTQTAPTEGNPVDITGTNSADYSQYFHSDNADYEIKNGENNVVQLAVKSQSHTHSLTRVDEKSATCTEDGNTAYYTCNGCDKWFSDAAGTQEITDKDSVVISKTGHSYDEVVWGYKEEDGHAHKCVNCGAHDEVQAHTPGAAATTTTPQTCTVCGYIIKQATGGGNQGGGSGGNKPGSGGSGDNGGENDQGGGSQDGGSGGNNGGADDNSGSGSSGGNKGSSDTGTTALGSGSSGTGQPRVKQEREGNIQKEVSVTGESTLDAAVTTPLSVLSDIVLTGTEKQQAAAGTDIKIVLDVKEATASVSAADKTVVEMALNGSLAKGYTLGQYLDINLYKIIGNSRSIVTNTNGKITVTIAVPDSLKNTDSTKTRTFGVIRVHDGKATLLTDLDYDKDTITIETDRFSTYVIVYKDTAGSGNSGAVRVSVKNDGSRKSGGAKDDEPSTGDHTPLALGATLCMITGLTYLLLYFMDRRHGMTEEMKREIVSAIIDWAKQGGRIRRWLALMRSLKFYLRGENLRIFRIYHRNRHAPEGHPKDTLAGWRCAGSQL